MSLRSFSPGLRAAVFGASGALGGAFCAALADDPLVETIYAGSRAPGQGASGKLVEFGFDLLDEASIAAAAKAIGSKGALDLVIVATGVLHEADGFQPEKSWRQFKPEAFARAFAVNATGPALIAKHFLPLLSSARRSAFAALSARVGSIEDNALGGWAAYRASKSALHQIIRTCAIELKRKNPHALCVSLHPGTVDSALSKPFQRGVRPDKLFTPQLSAQRLLAVIDGLKPSHSGRAFAWDGAAIPF